ncbi:MAG: DUF1385 domain-containing protein [Candidatus Magnetoovum sp. WYHC-5]|nr:DUF1385 domain-containing protein [Candidatus Magnetoovum sp. WYHC-5]
MDAIEEGFEVMKIGGQAVIEGVMMKSKDAWSVAVRDSKGQIHVKRENLAPLPKVLKLPVVRGCVALFQAMVLGIKALDYSASKAYDEDEGGQNITPLMFAVTIVVSFVIGIGIFIFLPLYITKLLAHVIAVIENSSFWFNFIDGIIRVLFFLLYVLLISMWDDIKKVFEYHGAEHKVIFAYEAGTGMDIDNIKKFGIRHPRCGTSFLFIVMIISIIVFTLIPKEWDFLYKFLSRVLFIPLIAGISYEILKLSDKASNNPIVRFLIQPGLLLQYITTKEPSDKQIEVALRALTEVTPLSDNCGNIKGEVVKQCLS